MTWQLLLVSLRLHVGENYSTHLQCHSIVHLFCWTLQASRSAVAAWNKTVNPQKNDQISPEVPLVKCQMANNLVLTCLNFLQICHALYMQVTIIYPLEAGLILSFGHMWLLLYEVAGWQSYALFTRQGYLSKMLYSIAFVISIYQCNCSKIMHQGTCNYCYSDIQILWYYAVHVCLH